MSNITKLMLFLVILIGLTSVIFAQENKLEINSFTIYSDSGENYQRNIKDGSTYNEFIKPGDKVEFEIELKNSFSKSTTTDINDIEIIVTVYSITEGQNLTEETSQFDLDPGEFNTKTIKLKIPSKAEELIKTADITITGIDDDNIVHEIKWSIYLMIEDESHELDTKIIKINATTIECKGSIEMFALISNNGKYGENDVVLEVKNKELGLNQRYTNIEIDEEETYTKKVIINVNEGTKPGIYPIELKTYYKEDHLDDMEIVDIIVKECKTVEIIDMGDEEEEDEEEIVKQEEPKEEQTGATEYTATKEKTTIALLVMGITIALIFIIVMVVWLVKK
ncbi:MAG: hypothetical protein KAU20_03450 [Nanoarchaeota archaeon]|nr:hypothetical protein [Nanoarchaeota archaeon]